MSSNFFEKQSEESRIKSRFVEKYFFAWAQIVEKHSTSFAYIDLFSGPGRYKDGSKSTPLLILEKIINNYEIKKKILLIFNDRDKDTIDLLKNEIRSFKSIEEIKNKPIIYNKDTGMGISSIISSLSSIPVLSFIDPWGYKGLSLELIGNLIHNWGCDCIFFFNYNRINMGLNNPNVLKYMIGLFGKDGFEKLSYKIKNLTAQEHELMIVEQMSQSLKSVNGNYTLPFCFKDEKGNRTSHCLFFVSKKVIGYKIMKEIMAKESSNLEQGVPTFTYCNASEKTPLLFGFSLPLDELEDHLMEKFSGEKIGVGDLIGKDHVGKRYLSKNYKTALKKLEIEGKIIANPPKNERRKGTMADHVLVEFPVRKK